MHIYYIFRYTESEEKSIVRAYVKLYYFEQFWPAIYRSRVGAGAVGAAYKWYGSATLLNI
jgi:hypothetical protein